MTITINPITERLKDIVKSHGATGWVVLKNEKNCCQRGGKTASLVCKNNKLIWLTKEEMR